MEKTMIDECSDTLDRKTNIGDLSGILQEISNINLTEIANDA